MHRCRRRSRSRRRRSWFVTTWRRCGRSLWQQVFAEAGLAPTRLHIATARLAFLGLGQLAALGWDGQLAATCSEDHRHCLEPLGSMLDPEALVISESEVRRAFRPSGAQAERLHRLFVRHHVLLIGAEPTHARLLERPGVSPSARAGARVSGARVDAGPAAAERCARRRMRRLDCSRGVRRRNPDSHRVPWASAPTEAEADTNVVPEKQAARLRRRIAGILASVQVQPEQFLRHVELDPAAIDRRSWEDVVIAVHAGASKTLGDGGAALAELVARIAARAPGNAWLRGVGKALRLGRPLAVWLDETDFLN